MRIRRPGDLVEAVPYLLGFHPRNSLVIVGLQDRRVQVTTRLDLEAVPENDSAAMVQRLAQTLARAEVAEAIGIVYLSEVDSALSGLPGDELPRTDLVRELSATFDDHGIVLADVLLAADERWWSYLCANADCCPPTGTALLGTASAPAAAATYAGMVALEDRESLEAMLAAQPPPAGLLDVMERCAQEMVEALLGSAPKRWRRAVTREIVAAARAVDAACEEENPQPVTPLSLDQVARFAMAINDIDVRDAVWREIDCGRVDGRPLWQQLATVTPSPQSAPALFLFGWAAWRSGNGALAGIAAERALDSKPGYSAADLLLTAVENGVDPHRFPRLFPSNRQARRSEARSASGATSRTPTAPADPTRRSTRPRRSA